MKQVEAIRKLINIAKRELVELGYEYTPESIMDSYLIDSCNSKRAIKELMERNKRIRNEIVIIKQAIKILEITIQLKDNLAMRINPRFL